MKKSKLLFVALATVALTSCGGQNNGGQTNIEKTDSVLLQEIADSLSNNNFTVEYNVKGLSNTFKAYRNNNYFFDTYNNNGYVVLEDQTVYTFNVLENSALLDMPTIGVKEEVFDTKFEVPTFNVAQNFVDTNGLFIAEEPTVLETFAHLTNSVVESNEKKYIYSVAMFLSDDGLKFSYRNENKESFLTGVIKDINSTTFEPIKNYLDNFETPEKDTSENNELKTLFGEGNFTGKAEVRTSKSKENFNFLIGEKYFYSYATDVNKGDGTVLLNDGFAYPFTLIDDKLNVSFDYDGNEDDYNLAFGLGRVDYSKFYKSGNNYFSKEYFNRKSLAEYFGITSYIPEIVQITLESGKNAAKISFYEEGHIKSTVNLTNINSLSFDVLDNYIKSGSLPKLESKSESNKLVEATKDLSLNYTIDIEDKFGSADIIKQTENIRKENWGTAYFYDRSENYLKFKDSYYEFLINKEEIDILPTSKMNEAEYQSRYDFKNIDFSTFSYLGTADGRYFTDSSRYATALHNITNTSMAITPTKAYISLLESEIKVEVVGLYNSSEYSEIFTIKDINKTVTGLEDYTAGLTQDKFNTGDKTNLKKSFSNLASTSNYTVKYYIEDLETGNITESDDDFYTKDAYYNSYYKDGIYRTDSNYFYQFYEEYTDPETEQKDYYLVTTPSNYQTIGDITPFGNLTDENYLLYSGDGNTFTTYDYNEIFRITRSFNYTDYIDKLVVTLNDDGTILFECFSRDYEQDSTAYTYSLFYKTLIHSVGTTEIPESAILPTWIK